MAARRGDANNDGTLNIFDILSVLKQMGESDSVAAGADYDLNGTTDIFDLLGLLRELSGFREKSEENLQFLAVIAWHLLTEPVVNPRQRWDEQGEVRSSYAIHADRTIEDAELIFNTDTVRGLEGTTPLIYKVDPDTVAESSTGLIFTEPILWKVSVKDENGIWHEDSGSSKFEITEPNVIVDYGDRLVGAEIEFPLVLRGAWQRFKIVAGDDLADTILIDLNGACLDSVVFPGIDSLATTIMEAILEDESRRPVKPHFSPLVGPATDFHTKQSSSRLILFSGGIGPMIEILPADNNDNLLKIIGFPGWIRRLPFHIADSNYEIESSWYERYFWRRIGRP